MVLEPDAREVDRIEGLMTVVDQARVDEFLDRCVVGSVWMATIRTAEVEAVVEDRHPLATIDERLCTCLRLRLELPVPVEPGLRFRITSEDAPELAVDGVIRPWGSQ